jgi:predicted transcriptional regulator
MSIHEERDIVLDTINTLSGTDQSVSYLLLRKELDHKYQFNKEQVAAIVRQLHDFFYIIRQRDNRDEISLTPKGIKLLEEGGFVELQRKKNAVDIEAELEAIQQTIAKLENRLKIVEQKSRTAAPIVMGKQRKHWPLWLIGAILLLLQPFEAFVIPEGSNIYYTSPRWYFSLNVQCPSGRARISKG